MKAYSKASEDLDICIARMQEEHHDDLIGVTVSALFVFDDDKGGLVLSHQGYPAEAVCRITPIRDRALGVADAVIVVDRFVWLGLTQPQREGLIDHELTHLERVMDEESSVPRTDAIGRPKLTMKRHDRQLGWFDEVATRHQENSPEMRSAKALVASAGQLYFDFHMARGGTPKKERRPSMQ